MLQFLDGNALDSDTIGTADTIAPAQILGFVKYESRGIPTPHLVNNMGLDREQIKGGNIEDNTMYVVVHASSKWLSLDTLEKGFGSIICTG